MTITESRTRLYSRTELQRLIAPRNVAIVGASTRKGSFGERVIMNMGAFGGPIYPVTASGHDTICGLPAYPSLAALPEVPDCAVLVVPRDAVEACVMDCARAGVGGAIVFASGFAETGKELGRDLQARLARIAGETGLRIVGPNCMGMANYAQQALMSFSAYHPQPALGPAAIGVASQSGAMSFSLGEAVKCGTSFSHLLSTGNMCDVDVADLVAYLCDEPACRAIVCVFEGMRDPMRLAAAAEMAWKANKPLIIHKIANGTQGAAAAVSHTGSLAGSNAAYRAMFERTGAVMAERFEDIIEMAAFFAKVPRGALPDGVAVLSPSGGAAIMAADFAEVHGVCLPQPGARARAVLEQRIPEFGSARNPCDVTAQVVNDPDSLGACAEALMEDSSFGTVVLAQPQAYALAAARVSMLGELARASSKMACNVLVSQWRDGPGALETEIHPHVALFRSMDRCFATVAAWQQREQRRAWETEPEWQPSGRWPDAARAVAAALRATTSKVIVESEAKRMLAAYGVTVSREQLVHSAENAVQAATGLGYPVALKVESEQLPHKTEAGVIRLNLADAAAVEAAYLAVMAAAERAGPQVEIRGVLIQQMIPPGLEMMIGGRVDAMFGPMVVVGFGGVLVELLNDTQAAIAPISPAQAMRLLQRLRGHRLFDGYRGGAPVDLGQLAALVSQVSVFIADQRETLGEIDINPVICSGAKLVAVDALIVRAPP
jgi:acyl-CoA synthetase (NDP forming)